MHGLWLAPNINGKAFISVIGLNEIYTVEIDVRVSNLYDPHSFLLVASVIENEKVVVSAQAVNMAIVR